MQIVTKLPNENIQTYQLQMIASLGGGVNYQMQIVTKYQIKWLHDIQLWYACNIATMTSYIKDSCCQYEIVTIHIIFVCKPNVITYWYIHTTMKISKPTNHKFHMSSLCKGTGLGVMPGSPSVVVSENY